MRSEPDLAWRSLTGGIEPQTDQLIVRDILQRLEWQAIVSLDDLQEIAERIGLAHFGAQEDECRPLDPGGCPRQKSGVGRDFETRLSLGNEPWAGVRGVADAVVVGPCRVTLHRDRDFRDAGRKPALLQNERAIAGLENERLAAIVDALGDAIGRLAPDSVLKANLDRQRAPIDQADRLVRVE